MHKFAVYFSALAAVAAVTGSSTTQADDHHVAQPSPTQAAHADDHRVWKRYWSNAGATATAAYKTVDDIRMRASETGQLTAGQIVTLNKYVYSPNMLVRLGVMSALKDAGPQQAQAAAAVARKGLSSIDS